MVYLRRPEHYLRSNYFKRLNYGFSLSFEEYATKRLVCDLQEFPLDYTVILELESWGAELIVRSYDQFKNGGLVSNFFQVIGVAPSALPAN